MNHESPDNPFRLGGRYKNRKGFFTVIELAVSDMRIRGPIEGVKICPLPLAQRRALPNADEHGAQAAFGV